MMCHVSAGACLTPSPRRSSLPLLLLCLCALLASCQKMTLDEEPGGGAGEPARLPVGTGLGTEDCPFTVGDVLAGVVSPQGRPVWVAGYAVGAAYRTLATCDFSPSPAYSSNILLSSDSLCTDASRCVPVELSTQKWKTLLSLPANPAGYRQCVMVQGTPATYYKTSGLRKVCAGRWLYGFDLSGVSRDPQEWQADTISW